MYIIYTYIIWLDVEILRIDITSQDLIDVSYVFIFVHRERGGIKNIGAKREKEVSETEFKLVYWDTKIRMEKGWWLKAQQEGGGRGLSNWFAELHSSASLEQSNSLNLGQKI